jgi:hypothetical protein
MLKSKRILPSFAIHWARELGEDANSLERLQGDINNLIAIVGFGSLIQALNSQSLISVD